MKKKILVIGGSGFLGSYLCNRLALDTKHNVTNFDIKKNTKINKKVKYVKGNILDYKALNKQISKNNIIFHFAGISDIEEASNKPVDVIKKNILSSAYILKLCVKHKIEKFIFASSIYVYSSSGSFYRISKTAVEDLIEEFNQKYNLNFLILRFGSLYGDNAPRTNGINEILYNLKYKKKLVYSGNIKTRRSYIHVEDAASLSVKLIKNKFKNNIYNITGKKNILISMLLNNLKKIFKFNGNPKFLNIKDNNHYIYTPHTFKQKKDILLKAKKEKNFYNELINVYSSLRR